MKEPKILVMPYPIKSEVFAADEGENIKHPKRQKLVDDFIEPMQKAIEANPDCRLAIALIYTPRPPELPGGIPFDSTHTAIVSSDDAKVEDLGRFLDMVIPSLVSLRIRVKEDPQVFRKAKEKK